MAVTCRNEKANAAMLANPASEDTLAIVWPLPRRSIANTMRARCRHALNVRPVSAGNMRLALLTEVAAREANMLKDRRF